MLINNEIKANKQTLKINLPQALATLLLDIHLREHATATHPHGCLLSPAHSGLFFRHKYKHSNVICKEIDATINNYENE